MNVFGGFENSRSAFLGLKRRRDCARVSYGAIFGEVFALFGAFFAKTERFWAVFEDFEKGRVVIALSGWGGRFRAVFGHRDHREHRDS